MEISAGTERNGCGPRLAVGATRSGFRAEMRVNRQDTQRAHQTAPREGSA